jgi:hypothetical protein
MKLKEIFFLVLALFCFWGLLALLLILHLEVILLALMLGMCFFLIIWHIREKRYKLIDFVYSFGFGCWTLTALFQLVFRGQDPQSRFFAIPLSLAAICQIASYFLRKNESLKTEENIRREFKRYFKTWNISLPEENLDKRKSGSINLAEWLIKFGFGREKGREYLEVYGIHPYSGHHHFKLLESGEREDLVTLEQVQGVRKAELIAELKRKDLDPRVPIDLNEKN